MTSHADIGNEVVAMVPAMQKLLDDRHSAYSALLRSVRFFECISRSL
jgi:hypothetical protein